VRDSESLRGIEHRGTRCVIVCHLDEQELARDGVLGIELLPRDDVGKLGELGHELGLGTVLALELHGDTREVLRLGLGDRETGDIELTATEHAGDAVEHAELVSHHDCDTVCLHDALPAHLCFYVIHVHDELVHGGTYLKHGGDKLVLVDGTLDERGPIDEKGGR